MSANVRERELPVGLPNGRNNSNPSIETDLDNLTDPEAEKIVLGSLLGGRNGEVPPPDVFFFPAHRTIYRALAEMESRDVPADIITLTQILRERDELDSVGGAAAVTELETSYSKSPRVVEYELSRLNRLLDKRKAKALFERIEEGDIDLSDALTEMAAITDAAKTREGVTTREPRIRFFAPRELRDYKPDNDIVLVGDCQVLRGEVFVIGGEPGVGKSRAATQLAVSGATGRAWFGLPVHRRFKTMIVQTENGRYRLQQEFAALDCDEIEDSVRISEPPPFGLTLSNREFQSDIGAELDSFNPDCVILDPWNAAARDDKQRDYNETFDALRNLLPTGADKPALGVIAHTRKPQLKEKRTCGTGLMHLLAGSYILTSVPRSIFVMTRGSEDETDNSVVWFNPKNNNGQNSPRSAWHRLATGFTPATDFDWTEFEKPPDERKIVTLEHVREVFEDGTKQLELKDAAHALATLAGISANSAYNALKVDGKFAANIKRDGRTLIFIHRNSLGETG